MTEPETAERSPARDPGAGRQPPLSALVVAAICFALAWLLLTGFAISAAIELAAVVALVAGGVAIVRKVPAPRRYYWLTALASLALLAMSASLVDFSSLLGLAPLLFWAVVTALAVFVVHAYARD